MNFEILPADLRRKFLIDYIKLKDIVSLSSTNKKYRDLIYNDNKLWKLFLVRDFPEAFYLTKSLGMKMKYFQKAYIRNLLRVETFLKEEAEYIYNQDPKNYIIENIFNELLFVYNSKKNEEQLDRKKINYEDLIKNYFYSMIKLKKKEKKHLKKRKKVLECWEKNIKIPPPSNSTHFKNDLIIDLLKNK